MKRLQVHAPKHRGLWVVAAFKIFKGALLLAVGAGALRLLHHDVGDFAERVVEAIRIDPHHHFVSSFLEKMDLVDDHKLKIISAVSFGYAALLLTEGVGLFLEKRWAEFLTIFLTASLIPLEIYEIVQHDSPLKIAALVVNVLVVVYLVRVVRQDLRPS